MDSNPTEPAPPTVNRDGRFYPFNLKWYVVVNDLVGGWAVSHIDKPLSEQDARQGEGDIFDCCSRPVAEYIVLLHNTRLQFAPEGWLECAIFPHSQYFVLDKEDGYHVYTDDDHGVFT